MQGAPLPTRANTPLRIVVAANTWLERHGLSSCIPATSAQVDVFQAENSAQLAELAYRSGARTVVLAEAMLVLRLLRSGRGGSILNWGGQRWVIACSDTERPELMRLLPQGNTVDISVECDARSVTVLLARLIAPVRSLPVKQQVILAMLRQGMTNKQIAAHLGLAIGTVKNHVSALYRHLNVSGRTQAALFRLDTDAERPVAQAKCV